MGVVVVIVGPYSWGRKEKGAGLLSIENPVNHPNVKKLFTLFIALSVFAYGCEDDDPSTTDGGTFVEAGVDGQNLRFEGQLAYATEFSTDNSIGVYGVDGDGRTLYILVKSGGGIGTYDMGFNTDATGNYLDAAGNTYSTFDEDGRGSLVITEQTNESIKGTFSFTAIDGMDNEVVVTNGEFDVNFRE